MAVKPLATLYAQAASSWHGDISRLGYPQAYDQLVLALPHVPPNACVLDAGAGTGALSQAWLNRRESYSRLTLLDNSQDMLDQAARNFANVAQARYLHASIGSTALPAASQDLILSAHVLEHLETPEDGLLWFAKLLKSGGRLALSVSKPHWCTALVRWRWGHKSYKPATFEVMLHDAGFTDIQQVAFKKGPPSRTSRGYVALRP